MNIEEAKRILSRGPIIAEGQQLDHSYEAACDDFQAEEARMEWYLGLIDAEIDRLTGGQGLTSVDFGDTVFLWDNLDDGVSAEDTAIEILENDIIGRQFLDLR